MKRMKKSMFFTTIAMVVLLVVALSTATFAWYISNNTAMTDIATVTAAASVDANIGIGWTAGSPSTSISFKDVVDFTPAVPVQKPLIAKATTDAVVANYAAVDSLTGLSAYMIADAFGAGKDSLKIFIITDAQLAATKIPVDLSVGPYFLTVSGNYERIYHTVVWVDSKVKVEEDINYTHNGQDRTTYATIYKVVTGTPAAGEISSTEAYTNVGEFVDTGNYIYKYDYYQFVAYEEKVPSTATFDFFSTTVAGTMNDATIQWDKVEELYSVKPSETNRFVIMTQQNADANANPQAATTSMQFLTAPTNAGGYFTANGDTATTDSMRNPDNTDQKIFFVSNNSANPTGTITMSITTSGDNKDRLRVAVLCDGKYVATLGSGIATYYGQIVNSAHSETSLKTYNATSEVILTPLAASASHEIELVAWYDGVVLKSANASKSAQFTITFVANAP